MPKFGDLLDFVVIDEFLTDMVGSGVISERRYAELMAQLDDAFENARSQERRSDLASASKEPTPFGRGTTH
jgi:hypothetical protein